MRKVSKRRNPMIGSEVGKLTLTVEPDALREAIAQGRLLELADKLATQAAAQISAQLVDHVAKAGIALRVWRVALP